MMRLVTTTLLLLFLVGTATDVQSQYLHRKGKDIVDGENNPVILRGMGLGGWMLQEGYMLETNSFANPQHQIRAKIVDVVGESNTQAFYDAWLKNHCTRRDIDSLASWGFNSVRLPMHYNLFTLPIESEPVAGENTWLERGFAMTDSLLKWCAANEMYLILDLHAAPGGQGNDAAISDYDITKPSLWQSEANQNKTIALWRKLAERYANEKWIGGYDLINETNWNFEGTNKNGCDETTNAPLKALFNQITAAIREVDTHHIIFIEGNCWANNHNGLLPFADDNTVLSFHKYWNYNDLNSIQGMINKRNQYNVPLWLGETGENSNVWFANAIRLMEANDIGWAWWPMKKVGSVVNPLTVVKNDEYEALLNYWKNGGTKPSQADAFNALMQLTENLKIENNIYRKDVVDAMFRQPTENTTKPFTTHEVPGVIHATDFDLGRHGKAYHDIDTGTYHVSNGGTYTAWNKGWTYRNDGVDIEANTDSDPKGNGYNIGWTEDGEWTQYTFTCDSSAGYNVGIRYASNGVTSLRLLVDGKDKTSVFNLPSSGGYGSWKTYILEDVVVYKGTHTLRVMIEKGGLNLSYVSFTLSKKISELPFKKVGAITEPDGSSLKLFLNKNVNPSTLTTTGFTLKVNGSDVNITSIHAGNDATELILTPTQVLQYGDVALLSYAGTEITSADGFVLESFEDLAVTNTIPFHHNVPGQIQAEDFTTNVGLQLENANDVGGGQNIGYTNTGDYLEYLVQVGEEGNYKLESRVASESLGGTFEVQQLNTTGTLLHAAVVTVPVTGGWQIWRTVNSTITLDEGSTVLRVLITQPEFNINWFRFTKIPITAVEEPHQSQARVYPNPTSQTLTILPPVDGHRIQHLRIKDTMGKVVSSYDGMDQTTELDLANLPNGTYILEFTTNGKRVNSRFVKL